MPHSTMFDRVGEEILRHMRGRYNLDELGDGKDELKFRKSGKTILTVYIRDGYYDFLIIFGRLEREKFETMRDTFSEAIKTHYDKSQTYHDGKWVMFPVRDLETLDEMKRLIEIKKRPNRKTPPKENAELSRCGSRCDLCRLYEKNVLTLDHLMEFAVCAQRIYGGEIADHKGEACLGCAAKNMEDACALIQCMAEKNLAACKPCAADECAYKLAITWRLEPKTRSADDITAAVLPYIRDLYEN